MKTETKEISISIELSRKIDKFALDENSRSEFLEKAVNEFIEKLELQEREKRDIKIINENADELNAEASDVLDFQFDW